MKYKSIVFDRDGTLNETCPDHGGYVLVPEELHLFPGVGKTMQLVNKAGLKAFVFTQQKGVGKGLLDEKGLQKIHSYMQKLLPEDGQIEKFYYCPHWPEKERCECAKPQPGMLHQIMRDYGYTSDEVLVLGDTMRDYESAKAAKCDFVFIKSDIHILPRKKYEETGCAVYDAVVDWAEEFFV